MSETKITAVPFVWYDADTYRPDRDAPVLLRAKWVWDEENVHHIVGYWSLGCWELCDSLIATGYGEYPPDHYIIDPDAVVTKFMYIEEGGLYVTRVCI